MSFDNFIRIKDVYWQCRPWGEGGRWRYTSKVVGDTLDLREYHIFIATQEFTQPSSNHFVGLDSSRSQSNSTRPCYKNLPLHCLHLHYMPPKHCISVFLIMLHCVRLLSQFSAELNGLFLHIHNRITYSFENVIFKRLQLETPVVVCTLQPYTSVDLIRQVRSSHMCSLREGVLTRKKLI